jgi:hypothetical protein
MVPPTSPILFMPKVGTGRVKSRRMQVEFTEKDPQYPTLRWDCRQRGFKFVPANDSIFSPIAAIVCAVPFIRAVKRLFSPRNFHMLQSDGGNWALP